ncbi:hypothetical protein [Planctomycetes bacterium TBK1r]|uniref:Beta-lactamase-inhibitor-like PepSY-like domain-containing protein n=1 Tax=Stieleria magnilauensis TaxID=2527963 RepID=A0ABX5XUL4_9BACT|nr:hypothetical protein TBK1r_47340 [Planctomycetes bacterium TBK1r]
MKRLSMLTLLTVCFAATAVLAMRPDEKGSLGEPAATMIKLTEAPAAVQEAIEKAAGSASISEIEQESDDGLTLYEAAWKVGDVDHEVVVNAAGHVMETEMVVAGDAVPAAVRATAAKHLPKGAKAEYEKKMIVLYEVEAVVDGKEVEFLVDPSGRVMELEADDDHDQEHEGDDDDDDDDDDDK